MTGGLSPPPPFGREECVEVQSINIGRSAIGSAPCDDSKAAKSDHSSSEHTKAPNRIVHLENLTNTVNRFLGPCPTCKGILQLEELETVSLATTLAIACKV